MNDGWRKKKTSIYSHLYVLNTKLDRIGWEGESVICFSSLLPSVPIYASPCVICVDLFLVSFSLNPPIFIHPNTMRLQHYSLHHHFKVMGYVIGGTLCDCEDKQTLMWMWKLSVTHLRERGLNFWATYNNCLSTLTANSVSSAKGN